MFEVVDAVDCVVPDLSSCAIQVLHEGVELWNDVSAEVGGLHRSIVFINDHHEGHECGAVQLLAVVFVCCAVDVLVRFDVDFECLLRHLAERQVVEESGNEKQGDETKSKN